MDTAKIWIQVKWLWWDLWIKTCTNQKQITYYIYIYNYMFSLLLFAKPLIPPKLFRNQLHEDSQHWILVFFFLSPFLFIMVKSIKKRQRQQQQQQQHLLVCIKLLFSNILVWKNPLIGVYMPLHYPKKGHVLIRLSHVFVVRTWCLIHLKFFCPHQKFNFHHVTISSCNRLITYFNISNPRFQQRSTGKNRVIQVGLQPSPKSSAFNVRHVKSHMSVTPGSGPRHLVFHPTLSAPWRIWNDGKGIRSCQGIPFKETKWGGGGGSLGIVLILNGCSLEIPTETTESWKFSGIWFDGFLWGQKYVWMATFFPIVCESNVFSQQKNKWWFHIIPIFSFQKKKVC